VISTVIVSHASQHTSWIKGTACDATQVAQTAWIQPQNAHHVQKGISCKKQRVLLAKTPAWFCKGSADNCLECQSDYKLDAKNNCHYRYTLILILVCSLFVTVFVCGILVAVRGCCTQTQAKPENYGSVLDDEIRKHAATVVSCIQEIGKTEDENDISVVESDTKPKKNQKQSFLDPLNDSVDTKLILSNLDEGVSVTSDAVPNTKFTVRGSKNR